MNITLKYLLCGLLIKCIRPVTIFNVTEQYHVFSFIFLKIAAIQFVAYWLNAYLYGKSSNMEFCSNYRILNLLLVIISVFSSKDHSLSLYP